MRLRDVIIYGLAFILLVFNLFWQKDLRNLIGGYPLTILDLALGGFVIYIGFFNKKAKDGKN